MLNKLGSFIVRFVLFFSHFVIILGLYLWNGGVFIFLSIFSLGVPLLFVIVPLIGSLLLVTNRSSKGRKIGLMLTLPITVPLVYTLFSLPLKTNADLYSGITYPTSLYVAPMIVGASIMYLTVTVLLYKQLCNKGIE
ncbi:hypothetical protein CYQ27_04115 [Enterococcus faecalis]|uniref:hypothetical protein n=1 Tax=Enterococcus faecalis TaxID=1351 RepID=UPI00100FA5A0|nr:hypothetical protein [Enterococcus faecalis]RXV47109.1 hypothetical protein CYQ27_04115 [Enterococcus faecalis]